MRAPTLPSNAIKNSPPHHSVKYYRKLLSLPFHNPEIFASSFQALDCNIDFNVHGKATGKTDHKISLRRVTWFSTIDLAVGEFYSLQENQPKCCDVDRLEGRSMSLSAWQTSWCGNRRSGLEIPAYGAGSPFMNVQLIVLLLLVQFHSKFPYSSTFCR